MLSFRAPNLSGTSVQYSPFLDNRLVLGTAANFGIVGNGKVFSLDIMNDGKLVVQSSFDTQDSVLGVAFSEVHESHVCVACGDGSVQLFDTTRARHPLVIMREHLQEVSSVNWSSLEKHQFCTSSWDGTIRLWTADGRPLQVLGTPLAPSGGPRTSAAAPMNTVPQQNVVYEAKYSPHTPGLIGSAHAQGEVVAHDARSAAAVTRIRMPPGSGECLTMDWNKYRPHTVASAGSDGAIRVWDLRQPNSMLNELTGHELAVKSVKWSPHTAEHLLSASFDMTAKVWTDSPARAPPVGPRGLIGDFTSHREFVTACDWSLWGQPGWVATTSFDSNLFIWRAIK